MIGIDDPSDPIFEEFEKAELESPCPRKIHNGRTIYSSRKLEMPARIGKPVLCDFGAAVSGEKPRHEDIQPDIYRCPEVILEVPWSYEVDIWNAGAMVSDLHRCSYDTTFSVTLITSHRFGIYLRISICSMALIPNTKLTEAVLILLKWLRCWVLLRRSCWNGANRRPNFLTQKVKSEKHPFSTSRKLR